MVVRECIFASTRATRDITKSVLPRIHVYVISFVVRAPTDDSISFRLSESSWLSLSSSCKMFFNAISCPISSSPASQTFAKHSSDAISSFCENKQAPHASFRAPSTSCNFILVSDELRYRAISQSNGVSSSDDTEVSAPFSCRARAAFRPNIMASSYNRTASSSLPADAMPAASALISRASRRDCCQRAMLGSSGDEPANKIAATAAERGVPNRFMAAIWAMAFQLLPRAPRLRVRVINCRDCHAV